MTGSEDGPPFRSCMALLPLEGRRVTPAGDDGGHDEVMATAVALL